MGVWGYLDQGLESTVVQGSYACIMRASVEFISGLAYIRAFMELTTEFKHGLYGFMGSCKREYVYRGRVYRLRKLQFPFL